MVSAAAKEDRRQKFINAAHNSRKGSMKGAGPFREATVIDDHAAVYLYFKHLDENYGNLGVFKKQWGQIVEHEFTLEELSNILVHAVKHLRLSQDTINHADEALAYLINNIDLWAEALSYTMAEKGFNHIDCSMILNAYRGMDERPPFLIMDAIDFGFADFIKRKTLEPQELYGVLKQFADIGVTPSLELQEVWEAEVIEQLKNTDINDPFLTSQINVVLYSIGMLALEPNEELLNVCIDKINEMCAEDLYNDEPLAMWSLATIAARNPDRFDQLREVATVLHKEMFFAKRNLDTIKLRQVRDACFYFDMMANININSDKKTGSNMQDRVRGIFSRASLGLKRHEPEVENTGYTPDFSLFKHDPRQDTIYVEVDGPQMFLYGMDHYKDEFYLEGYNGAAILQTERIKKALGMQMDLAKRAILMRLPFVTCRTLLSVEDPKIKRIAEVEMAREVVRNAKEQAKAGDRTIVIHPDLTARRFREFVPD